MPTGVLGTVAGDDTIFIACRGEGAAKRLATELAHAAGVGPGARGAKGAR
jgi:arginine repressor